VLDLSGLEFMDSSGVRVLIRCCSGRNEPLRVRGVQQGVRRILDITGVSNLLQFEESPADRGGAPRGR
jgi:anti-anti-sigma factor